MKTRYSQEFREQAVQKLLQRGDKTIECIAVELNINLFTLKYWLDEAANAEKAGLVEAKRVQHPNYDFNTLNKLAQLKH